MYISLQYILKIKVNSKSKFITVQSPLALSDASKLGVGEQRKASLQLQTNIVLKYE